MRRTYALSLVIFLFSPAVSVAGQNNAGATVSRLKQLIREREILDCDAAIGSTAKEINKRSLENLRIRLRSLLGSEAEGLRIYKSKLKSAEPDELAEIAKTIQRLDGEFVSL